MVALGELYDKKMSDALYDIYYRALSKFTIDQFDKAIDIIVNTRKYTKFPMPADFNEAIQGNPTNKAIEAFTSLWEAIKKHGSHKSIEFEDKAIHGIVEHYGGWQKVCSEWQEKDIAWRQKEFVKLYEVFKQRDNGKIKLIGFHEHNKGEFETVFVGKEKKRIC